MCNAKVLNRNRWLIIAIPKHEWAILRNLIAFVLFRITDYI